ncbi:MAG: potassium channel family protein [Streptomyces sp.]|nr:potassium channel family protein [Streptomyces sp.]
MRTTRSYVIDVARMQAFADAVIAIAITLLALEMTVPEGLPSSELGRALREELPTIGGYLLSFAVIALLWISNHRLFSKVEQMDRWLLRLDLVLLAAIAALPFPTRLISEYGSSALATSVYAGTIALCTALLAAMSVHLLRRPELLRPDVPRDQVVQSIWQAGVVALVFATSIPVTLISPDAAKYWWILNIPLGHLISRRADKTEDVPATSAV